MSRKKPVILGPDGRPYVAPPKKAEPRKATLSVTNAETGQETVISDEVHEWSVSFDLSNYLAQPNVYGGLFGRSGSPSTRAKKAAADPLRAAVTEQVGALVEDFDGAGGAEMPKPPRDLHTYADAFASAREKCQHPDAEDTIHSAREFYCPDCRRYISYAEYRRTRTGWGMFG